MCLAVRSREFLARQAWTSPACLLIVFPYYPLIDTPLLCACAVCLLAGSSPCGAGVNVAD